MRRKRKRRQRETQTIMAMTDEEVAEYLKQAALGDKGIAYLRDRLYRWFGREAVIAAIESDSDD